jgi:predicted DNA-binding transcriptional regulator AlpA
MSYIAANKKPWEKVTPSGQMLRPNAVFARTGLSKSQVYEMIGKGNFPPFIKLSDRASAMPEPWLESFIQECARVSVKQEEMK